MRVGKITHTNSVLHRGGSPRPMKLLALNCRWLNSTREVRSLLEVWRRINPNMCFLSETHLDTTKAEKVRRWVGFDHMLIYESDGRSGGLLMMWTSDISIRDS
jgi:hypothetical protein